MSNLIITISREFGSGGRLAGEKLAKELGIQFYDKEIIRITAEKSGLSPEFIEDNEERVNNNFLFSVATAAYPDFNYVPQYDVPINEKTFIAQANVIKELAGQGSCVIVGRCADYVLRDHENVLNVFIKASMEERIKRITRLYDLDPMKAEETIRKADKQRATYYNYYATGTWGDVSNYHLCLDTGVLGVDGVVELIRRAVELRQDKAEEDGIQW